MPVLEESSASSTIAEHIKLRKPRNLEADPNPQIPSIIQSTRCKSSISSLFLSTFSNNTTTDTKKKTFRGLGCTAAASQQVSVPAVIRTSADWEGKKVRKKKQQQHVKKKSNSNSNSNSNNNNNNNNNNNDGVVDSNNMINPGGSCAVIQDVWCGPGIDAVGSVDCVVTTKRNVVSERGKIDGDKISKRERERERERSACLARRTVNPESLSFWDSDSVSSRPDPDIFGTRYYRHVRHPSPEGFAEIMMLQNSLMMGGRLDSQDRFRDWRLDVDSMTYEQLLELGDRIGYVNTGLKEDEIGCCLRKIKHSILNDLPPQLPVHVDNKCTICQEEYEADDEMGKLECGHSFHLQCIKQWLTQKNTCPVCKTAAVARC